MPDVDAALFESTQQAVDFVALRGGGQVRVRSMAGVTRELKELAEQRHVYIVHTDSDGNTTPNQFEPVVTFVPSFTFERALGKWKLNSDGNWEFTRESQVWHANDPALRSVEEAFEKWSS